MNITLSADHRIIDGMLAAQFVDEIKELLENPLSILLK
jgi:pyruvate dehydrogenase E2 component (dihydrolipoamide acetyltransferase)